MTCKTKVCFKTLTESRFSFSRVLSLMLICSCAFVVSAASKSVAPVPNTKDNDAKLLDDYIASSGQNSKLLFDASNIKQYWIDYSVISKKDYFTIATDRVGSNKCQSVPLKIQLINVDESQNCTVEVITQGENADFFIKDIPTDITKKEFLNYKITSSSFSLEKTSDFSFYLVFTTNQPATIPINKIVVSFSTSKKNACYISKNDVKPSDSFTLGINDFSITGKKSTVLIDKKIPVSNNTLTVIARVKNTGTTPANIALGYSTFTENDRLVDFRHYPYSQNLKALKVVSTEVESGKIIVESCSDWKEGCFVALNAKDDFSDIPNLSIIGKIKEVDKLVDGQIAIVLDRQLKSPIEKGSFIRLMAPNGGNAYYYTKSVKLQPGEEYLFVSRTKKDDNCISFDQKTFPKGVLYVKPIILSYSVDSNVDNTILINSFTISY